MPAQPTSAARAWFLVVYFMFVYVLSGLDRYFLALVAPDVIAELKITDTQMGLLLGAGFAVVYSLAGLPLAHWIDQSKRLPIVAAGVAMWSLCTILGAFATNFFELAASRAGLAIGEAVLAPAAISLIGDLFTRERRAAPIAAYSAMGVVMGTGAMIIGGAVLSALPHLPGFTDLTQWRRGMIAIGLPGLVLAAGILLFLREPERRTSSRGAGEVGWAYFIGELLTYWRFYLPFYVGVASISMFSLGLLSWSPTILVRLFGISQASAAYLLGVIGVPASIVSAFFWSLFAAHLIRRGQAHGVMIALVLSMICMAPLMLMAPLTATALQFALGVGLLKLLYGQGPLVALAVQTYGPSQIRGRLTAVTNLVANVVGLSLGAVLIPVFADLFPQGPRQLVYGLTVLGALTSVGAIGGYGMALRAGRRMEVQD